MKKITTEEILRVINSVDNITVSAEQTDESLIDLGMDSISFIQVVVGLEESFDCEIPDSKLLISEMDTVGKIFAVLKSIYEEQSL